MASGGIPETTSKEIIGTYMSLWYWLVSIFYAPVGGETSEPVVFIANYLPLDCGIENA
jgi:hypothetical protein